MSDPNYSELLSTTMQYLESEMQENMLKNNGLLFELEDRGNVKTFDGGPSIVQPIAYAENVTYKRMSGYEVIDITPSTVFSAAQFAIKQVTISVSMSGLEMLINSGKSQKFDLMEERIKNAELTFENNFSSDLYSTGTADSGKQIGGLQLLVADAPGTGTVGGIDRSLWSFWRNQYYSFSANSVSASATTIQPPMNSLYLSQTIRKTTPKLGIADNTYFGYFEASLQSIQRIVQDGTGKNKMADAGFQSYLYKGIPIVFDGGLGGACPANHMYLLNTDYIYLRPHKDRQLTQLNPERFAVNQDAVVRILGWAGNLTISNCRHQGVIIA